MYFGKKILYLHGSFFEVLGEAQLRGTSVWTNLVGTAQKSTENKRRYKVSNFWYVCLSWWDFPYKIDGPNWLLKEVAIKKKICKHVQLNLRKIWWKTSVVMSSFSNDERARPPTPLKTESTKHIFRATKLWFLIYRRHLSRLKFNTHFYSFYL